MTSSPDLIGAVASICPGKSSSASNAAQASTRALTAAAISGVARVLRSPAPNRPTMLHIFLLNLIMVLLPVTSFAIHPPEYKERVASGVLVSYSDTPPSLERRLHLLLNPPSC